MRHRKHTFKIGRTSGHRKSLLANAVCSLIEHGRIQTTLVKAKEARRAAEKLVTPARPRTPPPPRPNTRPPDPAPRWYIWGILYR